jgi:hypothetical protein
MTGATITEVGMPASLNALIASSRAPASMPAVPSPGQLAVERRHRQAETRQVLLGHPLARISISRRTSADLVTIDHRMIGLLSTSRIWRMIRHSFSIGW